MKKFLFIFALLALSCTSPETNTPKTPPKMEVSKKQKPFENTKQLVLVIAPNNQSTKATMCRFERKQNAWQKAGKSHPVTLGKNGLGWGLGLHQKQEGYYRKEGDGKSPKGIFSFGSAFGYAPSEKIPLFQIPYIHLNEITQCIEDTKSKYYNQIVQDSSIEKDWDSSDFMRRNDDHVYKWGVFVNHNVPSKGDAGSCIFMHLWRAPNKPTVGCTGMSEANMLDLLQWLSPKKQPILVQLTEKEYPLFQEKYEFPAFAK